MGFESHRIGLQNHIRFATTKSEKYLKEKQIEAVGYPVSAGGREYLGTT